MENQFEKKILKSQVVERLLKHKQITAEEAVVLLDNQMEIPSIQPIPNLQPDHLGGFDPSKCSCNPVNGGSGICGCIRGAGDIRC